MESYKVSIDGQTYTVNSPQPLSDEQAYMAVKGEHEKVMSNRKAAIAADAAAEKTRFKEAEAARPLDERIWSNLGAGFDTAWQGAKQLGAKVGIGEGVSDEELQESRQRKGELAEGTTGGGLIQLAGEIAPTLIAPVGASGSLARVATMGALGGAGAGALQPVLTSESRLGNMAMGAAGGAAAPLAVRGAVRALPRALGGRGEAGTTTRAGKRLVRALGGPDEAADAAARLEAPRTGRLTRDIPLTAAEKAGSPELAALELQARRDMPIPFTALERQQNEGLFDAAMAAGREGTDLRVDRLDRVRQGRTAPMREDVMEKAGKFSHVAEPLQAQVDALRTRSAAGSPQRALADLVERSVQENANPAQLYELRKLLTSKLNGPMIPGDELASITKGAQRETMQMIEAIDKRLNEAAQRKGGSATPFEDYLREFQARSGPVESARAQQLVNRELSQAGRPLVGQSPEITRSVLKRALEKNAISKKFGSKLEPGAQARYDELMQLMQQMEEPVRTAKIAGTGGGGSQTSFVQQLGKGLRSAGRLVLGAKTGPAGPAVLDALTDKLTGATREEVARMMLDPQHAARGIRQALQAGRPLSDAEQAFLAVARSGAAGVPLALSGAE